MKYFLFFCLLISPFSALASTLELGVGAEGVRAAYRNYDVEWTFAPVVNFDSDYIYVRDYGVGINFITIKADTAKEDTVKDDNIKENEENEPLFAASLYVAYDDFHFNPRRARDMPMKKLSSRRDSYFAGIRLLGVTSIGAFEATAARDILGRSDGWYGEVDYYLRLDADVAEFFPFLGAIWADYKYNAYYYGVNHKESLASGLPTYKPKASVAPFIGLAVAVPLFKKCGDKWNWVSDFKASYVPDTIKGSPMAGRTVAYVLGTMITYTFK